VSLEPEGVVDRALGPSEESTRSAPRRSILDLPHGLHFDVPPEVYYEKILGVANASALKSLSRTPAHYRAWFDDGDQDSEALAFGRAFHLAILEPAAFDAEYTLEPVFGDCRKKENKANRDAWRAENTGKKLLSQNDFASIRGMARALQAHPESAGLIARARTEVTLRWRDAATGIECKGRADGLVETDEIRVCFDLKTTDDASPSAFARSCATYRYHVQQAFYVGGFLAIGRPLDAFLFVAVEKAPPFAVAVYQLSERAEKRGRELVARDLQRLSDACERDAWPAYPDHITELELPAWA
jgi:hypothetical protein